MILKHTSHSRHKSVTIASFLLLFIGVYTLYALCRPLPHITVRTVLSSKLTSTSPSLTWPLRGSAAVGTPEWGVLASTDTTPRPTASTIKLLTALTILQAKPFSTPNSGETLTLDTNDVAFYEFERARGGAVVPVVTGEVLTERQALEALLLPSANNIATTLGVWAYGSTSAYLSAANRMAKSLDMMSTHIADTSGFSSLTTSTPGDLIKLGIAAFKNPIIASIMSEKSAALPIAGTVHNVNVLVGTNSIIGGKTGNTPEAGGCFIGIREFQKDGHFATIVSAIMDAPSLDSALEETLPLENATAQNIIISPLVTRNEVVATYDIPWETTSFQAVAAQDIAPLRWIDQTATIAVHNSATTTGQRTAGDITVTIKDKHYTAALELTQPIPPPSPLWRLTHLF